jgi:tetratricopeptide (TPR) repeat protein
MGDCEGRAGKTAPAIDSYRLAAKLAAETKQPKLESLANVSEAALESRSGQVGAALQLYQHALQLDDSIGDRSASAEDWYNYGRFLDSAGFPARLSYACLVKSTMLRDSLSGATQRKIVMDAVKQAASRVGSDAGAIRRDPEPFLREALTLRP